MPTAGSVFTTALVTGLRTGAADTDRDGYISIDDAYDYAYQQVRTKDAAQTPQRWLYGAEGKLLLARNPVGRIITPEPLPEAIRVALDSPHPDIRIGATNALRAWLTDPDPARVLAAQQAFRRVADTDIPSVAIVASAALGGDGVVPGQGSEAQTIHVAPTERVAIRDDSDTRPASRSPAMGPVSQPSLADHRPPSTSALPAPNSKNVPRTENPSVRLRCRWLALGVLWLSLLIVALGNTIIDVALLRVNNVNSYELFTAYDHGYGCLQWIVDAYTLVFACLAPVGKGVSS